MSSILLRLGKFIVGTATILGTDGLLVGGCACCVMARACFLTRTAISSDGDVQQLASQLIGMGLSMFSNCTPFHGLFEFMSFSYVQSNLYLQH